MATMIPGNLEPSGTTDSCAATVGDPEENLDDVVDDLKETTSEQDIKPVGMEDKGSCSGTSQGYVDCPIEQDPAGDKSVTVTALTELSGQPARESSTPHRSRKVMDNRAIVLKVSRDCQRVDEKDETTSLFAR